MASSIANQIFGFKQDIDYLAPADALSFDSRKGVKARKTKALHSNIAKTRKNQFKLKKLSKPFNWQVDSSGNLSAVSKASCILRDGNYYLDVKKDDADLLAAKVALQFWSLPRQLEGSPSFELMLNFYGTGQDAPRIIWNTIDEWVRRVSSFQSLFELYGHFTEPYPYFRVAEFSVYGQNPWLEFAAKAADHTLCSRYLNKEALLEQFAGSPCSENFEALAQELRSIRFDIRTRETNIAIPEGKYMMAYPFTLPESKQMNFSLKIPPTTGAAAAYVTEKRNSA